MDFSEMLPILMFLALALLLFTGYPVAFVLGGVAIIFGGLGILLGDFRAIEFYSIVLRIWGGIATNLLLVAVPSFVFMGIMLERSGVADDLLRAMQLLLGSLRGGLAVAVTAMGTILAASTGIIGASVVMMSILALPTMLKNGYQIELSVGTICASATLGILIPPSIMLVVMADLLSISVGDLFMGAILPGLLLSGLYVAYIVVIAHLRPHLAPLMPLEERSMPLPQLVRVVSRSLLPPSFLIFLVLGSIFFGLATPTEAAGVGATGSILLAWFNRMLTREVWSDVVQRTARIIGMVFSVIIGATAFSYVFRSLGGEELIEEMIFSLPFGPWGVTITLLALVFLLGFFFDWIEITLIVLPVFAPIIGRLDFGGVFDTTYDQVVWFAMLVAINLQTSFLTPPFGFALFFLKGVAPPEVKISHIYRGIIPFVLLQLLGMAIVMMFPEIVLILPKLAYGPG